jgi:hypothetical protein
MIPLPQLSAIPNTGKQDMASNANIYPDIQKANEKTASSFESELMGEDLEGEDIPSEFDPSDFQKFMRQYNDVQGPEPADDIIDGMREEQNARGEEIFRKYPFEDTKLPVLPDCNQYFSGKYKDYIWHQNADQVYVYIPIDSSITKKDIDVEFRALKVVVHIKELPDITFDTVERIIPDGSFWTFEKNSQGELYLQLDLEKRFRMINWKSLFEEARANPKLDELRRTEMMEKLFAANKGMSKLTGQPAETMDEMMSNEQMVKMMGQKYFPDPQVIDVENGELEPQDLKDLEGVELVQDDNDDDEEGVQEK